MHGIADSYDSTNVYANVNTIYITCGYTNTNSCMYVVCHTNTNRSE